MLPPDIMTQLDLGAALAASPIGIELRDARTPEHSSSSSTIYITPDRFVMRSGGQSMVWDPSGGAGSATMWFGNAESGAYTPVDLQQINSFVGGAAQHSGIEPTPMPGATRTIAGHSTRGYAYDYEMDLAMGGFPGMAAPPAGAVAGAQNVVTGEAWIADDLPEADQIAAFFRRFADSFDGGMLGGQIGVMADLAALGVPLETKETLRTYLISQIPGSDERQLLVESVSTSTVTNISMATLTDEELFGPGGMPTSATAGSEAAVSPVPPGTAGAAGVPDGSVRTVDEGCDCSCEAAEELQAISELPEDEQAAHPRAMPLAMCAPECAMRWIACSRD